MTPDFRITADGADVTARIADRLLSITVTDNDGEEADRVEIRLDDRDGKLEMPELEAKLEIALGFRGESLEVLGIFAVDGVSGEGPRQAMTITATAADMTGDLRTPKTRGFEGKTLRDIVEQIAAEAGLRAVVGDSVAGIDWPYLAQTAESGLNFLTRIAADLDATAKPAGGALIVQRRGEGKTAAGDTITPPEIGAGRLQGWSWQLDTRSGYKSVEAEWSDTGGGKVKKVKEGSGAPLKKLRKVYGSKAEAERAARAALQKAERSAIKISAELAGFDAGLMAGGSVMLDGLPRPELNGEWHLTRVTHKLDGTGLVSSFDGQKAMA